MSLWHAVLAGLAACVPVLVYLFYSPHRAPATYISLSTILISLLVLAKHRGNMERLVAGKESRLGLRQ